MKLSIVTTLYNSSSYIKEFHERIVQQACQITPEYEIVLVNDGSPDSSLASALDLASNHPNVKVIDLPKNYGHHRAMMIGLEHSVGEYVYLTDVDLEEPPESLTLFWNEINSDVEMDVIYGITKSKKRPLLRGFLSNSFYTLFNYFTDTPISPDHMVSRLMRRQYVDALLQHPERELFIAALWLHVGFNQKGIETLKDFNGDSSYTLVKRIKLAVNALTAFSSKPLIYIFYLGMTITALAVIASFFILVKKFFYDDVLQGWTTIVLAIYLMGGVTVFSLGIIGIYISKIYTEVKSRPVNLVRRVYQYDNSGSLLKTKNKI